jgi:hypothetical protein
MSWKTSLTDRSKPILPDLDLIATQTGMVVRKSLKFTPAAFLLTLMSAVVTGKGSFNQLVTCLKDRVNQSMARQSLHERIGIATTSFMMGVICDLMHQRFKASAVALGESPILRVIIEDASSQVMPKGNAETFPAHGNHHGATAGVKIDLAYDLLSDEVISHSLHLATEQDKTIGKELIVEIRQGDLVLRDMGYFSLSEFTVIEACGAWWLTRLPLTTGVKLENGKGLETKLRAKGKSILDLNVIVGAQGKRCRLVAMRAEAEVTSARRAKRMADARKAGKQPCQIGLQRDAWHLMLTNLDADQASVSQLAAIYRARWAVEIQFRAWKQSLNLTKALNRVSNEHHIQALVIAAMIVHQLGMKFAKAVGIRVGRAQLSYEKLYHALSTYLLGVSDIAGLECFDQWLDIRHIKRDRRRRKSPIESGVQALP